MCGNCHALVYSEQLGQLAAEAKELEAKPDYRQARERALMGLPLLPSNSRPLRTLLCFNISNCGTRLTFDGVDWAPIVNIHFGKTKVTLSRRYSR